MIAPSGIHDFRKRFFDRIRQPVHQVCLAKVFKARFPTS
jgi:hypothetical protein